MALLLLLADMTRRGLVTSLLAAAALPPLRPAVAAGSAAARVALYPPVQYLEPVYELKLSLDALAAIAPEPTRWPALKKRLDAFFGGGVLSECNYYAGLALQYTSQIKYDDLPVFVDADRKSRQAAMEDCLGSMGELREALGAPAPVANQVTSAVAAAQKGIASWLALVPQEDVAAAERLFVAVRRADVDHNGKLSDEEAKALASDDRAAWAARVALVGD